MIEKPMLFSAAMVKAILEGRKTQTRRVVKPKPEFQGKECFGNSWGWICGKDGFSGVTTEQLVGVTGLCYPDRIPHPIGSRIWVKETFKTVPVGRHVVYRADEVDRAFGSWKPSIFMPRAYSRIDLEVTAVRVERLKEISEQDAWQEGCVPNPTKEYDIFQFTNGYAILWESINGKGSWASNPWVWVYTFKRIKP